MVHYPILDSKRAVFLTLGCKLNFAETASLQEALSSEGCHEAAEGEAADVCVVNTCSVTEEADRKCRQAIRRLHRLHPGACLVVMGCYAQLRPDQPAEMEGVDLVIGQGQKATALGLIAELLETRIAGAQEACHRVEASPAGEIRSFVPSCACGDRTRYFLKVQDGCNYFCTYCTIPLARGRSRNGSIASLVEQARGVARRGGREIVLTGVNVGDFGRSTGESFIDLIRALDCVEGIDRYRISSIEPNLLTDEIIDFVASSRSFMPHFHIPLQSGSDTVLRLMHRRYDTAFFAQEIDKVQEMMPDAFIGVDIIVGTRGETAELFEESCAFVQSLPVAQLHVFPYSERPSTRALLIPHVVPAAERHERTARLIALSKQKHTGFLRRFAGTKRPVLWEHTPAGEPINGFTDNYLRIVQRGGTPMTDNTISNALLTDLRPDGESLWGDTSISD